MTINNYRMGGYTLFALGLINWRYQSGSEGTVAQSMLLICVGAAIILMTFPDSISRVFMKKWSPYVFGGLISLLILLAFWF